MSRRDRAGPRSPAPDADHPCYVNAAVVADDEGIELFRPLRRGSHRRPRWGERPAGVIGPAPMAQAPVPTTHAT